MAMNETSASGSPAVHYVRTEEVASMPPPSNAVGPVAWIKQNLFSSIPNTIMTLIGVYLLYLVIPPLIKFAIIDAVWTGEGREACATEQQGGVQPNGWFGWCYAFVDAKMGQFIYGRYPFEERWRIDTVFIIGILGLVPLLIPIAPFKTLNTVFMLGAFPVIALILLTGGNFDIAFWVWALTAIVFAGLAVLTLMPVFAAQATVSDVMPGLRSLAIGFAVVAFVFILLGIDFGLEFVETPLWGGVLVTLVIAITGIVASLPIGIVLALGRRSELPIVKFFSIVFIEFWRGIPLVTVLFMSSVMLPLFLPEGVTFDKLLRALIGVALFASAYMAEVVRGGLQAIPKGQYEGAMALGLPYWRMMNLIVLPQALKLVIPGIVNTFIGLFKDTTLVLIIGLFDLLGVIQLSFTDANWSTPVTSYSGYFFAALFYFVFCFGMSRYSMFMEERLHTGHKR
ncbi:MAG: amino acid ABC transporter permease [Pseudomonadota bacterium]